MESVFLLILASVLFIVILLGWCILVPYLRRHPLLQQLTTDIPQFFLILFIPILICVQYCSIMTSSLHTCKRMAPQEILKYLHYAFVWYTSHGVPRVAIPWVVIPRVVVSHVVIPRMHFYTLHSMTISCTSGYCA